jgi:hypothetical protein
MPLLWGLSPELYSFAWWYHVYVFLHDPCSLMLMSVQLKVQTPFPIFIDWFWQANMLLCQVLNLPAGSQASGSYEARPYGYRWVCSCRSVIGGIVFLVPQVYRTGSRTMVEQG